MAANDSGKKERGASIHSALEWLLVVLLALGVALFCRAFVAEVYEVPSGSMLETIQIGDRLIGEKLSYHFTSPKRGDIVTFRDPQDPSTTLIKRVIATGGQKIHFSNGHVYIDGELIDEPYTDGKPTYPLDTHAPGTAPIEYPYTVPDGYVWVMGDNRTNSLDSRYFGAVPLSSITSHGLFIFWPPSDARCL